MSFKQLYAKVTADAQKERLIYAIYYRIDKAYTRGLWTTGFFNSNKYNHKWPNDVIKSLEDAGFRVDVLEQDVRYDGATTYEISW